MQEKALGERTHFKHFVISQRELHAADMSVNKKSVSGHPEAHTACEQTHFPNRQTKQGMC